MQLISSLSVFHKLLSIPPPLHPLVSVVQVSELHAVADEIWKQFATSFYTISLKNDIKSAVRYGQHYYDFDSGTMTFVAPGQVLSVAVGEGLEQAAGSGYALMFHPDFLSGHPLAAIIKKYSFFSYAVTEALHLSEKEEANIKAIFEKIEEEYQHIDQHTQGVILAQIDALLHYSNRFYERQFITRKAVNNDLLAKTEQLIASYFDGDRGLHAGVLTVEYLAGQLSLSPGYLSDMLRSLSGRSAQQHIHEQLIEKAKEYLTTTTMSVAEIAYHLGFERPQSFNKLFKAKTAMSPLQLRQSFG